MAQSKIFVENRTDSKLQITELSLHGDKVNKNAWKKGAESIAPGERKSVLMLNRSGKSNWMDPTPRFVEPDKTVTFHASVGFVDAAANTATETPVILLQKLYGEGMTTKMWFAIDGVNEPILWEPGDKEYNRQWVTARGIIEILFRAIKDGKNTHVEYIFSNP